MVWSENQVLMISGTGLTSFTVVCPSSFSWEGSRHQGVVEHCPGRPGLLTFAGWGWGALSFLKATICHVHVTNTCEEYFHFWFLFYHY